MVDYKDGIKYANYRKAILAKLTTSEGEGKNFENLM